MNKYQNGAKNKIPTNKNATPHATQGKCKIDIEDAFCSSPPATTPNKYKNENI